MRQRALVIFLGKDMVDGPAWWARWLSPGFAHCFVVVESQGLGVRLEGQNGIAHITVVGPFSDVAGCWEKRAIVVEASIDGDAIIHSPLAERTCVGLIKSVLGVRERVFTPWQLYKYLVSER